MNKPTKLQAAIVSAVTSLLFMVVYGGCNWLTAQRHDVGTWFYSWERYIPFVPWLIVPYMSIDAFFVAAPFLCKSRDELETFARRISFCILVAGMFFLLVPLKMGIARPVPTGWTSGIFKFLHGFDQPYNLFPSLHITLRTILAALYVRHTRGPLRWANRIWFSLIGFSTLLTYQHHVVDVLGGFVLAGIAFYLFREHPNRLPVIPNYRIGTYYLFGSLTVSLLSLAAWPWTAILLWPTAALLIVSGAYFGLGPGIYRKADGQIPFPSQLFLAPCLLGQYLSLLYYRRQCDPWNKVTPNVWIGTKVTDDHAAELKKNGVTAVLDLTSEFSETPALRNLNYKNIPILDLTALNQTQLCQAASFIREQAETGVVYVHCKVGYSRTAAAVAAYLLTNGLAQSADDAIAMLRTARPTIIIRPEAERSIRKFAGRSRAEIGSASVAL